jgi:hypothetical protein
VRFYKLDGDILTITTAPLTTSGGEIKLPPNFLSQNAPCPMAILSDSQPRMQLLIGRSRCASDVARQGRKTSLDPLAF